ncbi:MAG: flippase-like domain-containing protein [Chloroflexi bacterium]|nr:flippase-like domain-containing protein [Chloroflexota bacterium]
MSTVNPESVPVSEAGHRPEPVEGALPEQLPRGRSILSFLLALAILLFFATRLELDLPLLWSTIKSANTGLFLLAFVTYYLTFPLRGLRWRFLLENVGLSLKAGVRLPSLLVLSRMLYLSWFANCVIPAKLGDAYRGYQLKQATGVSFSTVMGTVLAERFMDMVVLMLLLVAATLGLGGAQAGAADATTQIFLGGVLLMALGVVGLGTMWGLRGHLHRLLPRQVQAQYLRFQEGTLGSFRNLPVIFLLSVAVWFTEAGRLFLVVQALGLNLNLSFVIFASLAASLLTVVPFTPGGLGLVEAGVVGLLLLVGVSKEAAVAATLLDRAVSYWSIVGFGFVLFALRRRV